MNPILITDLFISPEASIYQAIDSLNRNVKGIVLVVDADHHLLGTITDGDIRRAVVDEDALDTPIAALLARKSTSSYPRPITASVDASTDEITVLMKDHVVRQIPILDEQQRVVDLVTWEDLLPEQPLELQAVVLAGGQATRLHPLAEDLPRPMLPIGNRPLLELTIAQLRQAGIRQINLTTHYKPESIIKYFGTGEAYGVHIHYTTEEQPMGTAGTIRLLEPSSQPILVVNGDVLTRIDYRAMLDHHSQQRADMSVAVRRHEFQIPYGVVDMHDGFIRGIREKPAIERFINAGVYLLNPDLLAYIPKDRPYDMPELINRLVAEGRRVTTFPVHEYWLDIQEYRDYQQMQADAQDGLFKDLDQAALSFEPGSPAPPGFIPLCVPEISGNERAYIKDCLDTNWVSSVGAFVNSFEKMLAEYVGTKYAVATTSGTAALHIALLVAGVQQDDEVLISTLTFIAPANAIRYVGAWPAFIDAEPQYWQMDPQQVVDFLENKCKWRHGALFNKITHRRVRAIIPVHILGHPCDMDPILEIARKYNLRVIEDAAESLGAQYKGLMVGHLSDISCFSFNGNKIITTGGGGMLVTDNEAWARKARYLTTQAKDNAIEYIHNEIGYNYRLTNIQAAMGCAQLEQLDSFIKSKRRIAATYTEVLKDIAGIETMPQASWAKSTYWMFTILFNSTERKNGSRKILNALNESKIQTRPLWQPMHLSSAHKGSQHSPCPVAERLNRDALSLPCSIGISDDELQFVIDALIAES